MKFTILFLLVSLRGSLDSNPFFFDKDLQKTCLRTVFEEYKSLCTPSSCLLVENKAENDHKKTIFINFRFFYEIYLIRILNEDTICSSYLYYHELSDQLESKIFQILDDIYSKYEGVKLDIFYTFSGVTNNRIILKKDQIILSTISSINKFRNNNSMIKVGQFELKTREDICKEYFNWISVECPKPIVIKSFDCEIILMIDNISKIAEKLRETIKSYECRYRSGIDEYFTTKRHESLDKFDYNYVQCFLYLHRMHGLTFEEIRTSRWNILIFLLKFIINNISLKDIDVTNEQTVELYEAFLIKNREFLLRSGFLSENIKYGCFCFDRYFNILNLISKRTDYKIENCRDLVANFFIVFLKESKNCEKILQASFVKDYSMKSEYVINQGVNYYINWLENYIAYRTYRGSHQIKEWQSFEFQSLDNEFTKVISDKKKELSSKYFYFRNNEGSIIYGSLND